MNPGISAEVAAATTLRARFVITLLKTPAYRGTLKETRGFVKEAVIRQLPRHPSTATVREATAGRSTPKG
jgi:hypothetical protein